MLIKRMPDPSGNMNEKNQADDQQERFETDTQKLLHRHLSDKDHVITDEELKSIRVGMVPGETNLSEEA